MRRIVVVLFVYLSVLSHFPAKGASVDVPERMTVGVLFFEDKNSNPDMSYWQHLSSRLLTYKFHEAKSIKVLSDNAIRFGYRQIEKKHFQAIDHKQARKIGELIEARRVVFGSYRFKAKKWRFEAFVLNTASGKVSKKITSKSTDFFDASTEIVIKVLDTLGIEATEKELEKISEKWTTDSKALEYAGKGLNIYENEGSYTDQEDYFRKAIARDEQFSLAYSGLMAALGSQGKFDELESVIEKALQIDPDNRDTHLTSGVMSLFKYDLAAAEKSFKKAISLDKDYPAPLSRLGELCTMQKKLDEAITYYEKTIAIDAFDADTYSSLSLAYALKRQRENAAKQLLEIERLDPEKTMNSDQMIFQTYYLLGDLPKAAKYGERFVELALKKGVQPQIVQSITKTVEKFKESLTPAYLSAEIPTKYSTEQLQKALEEKLTKQELKLVVNPLKSNNQIDKWALKLTKGVDDDFDKAKAIFDAMIYRIQPKSRTYDFNAGTAEEVFVAWNNTDRKFICQESTKLYVALARAVKLEAFAVNITKLYNDDVGAHMCAGVFLDGKLLLVDPLHKWFGVPHKEFAVMDDLQMIAFQLSQTRCSIGESEALRRIGIKLSPDDWMSHANLAVALIEQKKWQQASKVADKVVKLNPGYYHNYLLSSLIALHNGNIEQAEKYVRKALEINPKHSASRLQLGELLVQKGKLKEARDEFRAGLKCVHRRENGEIMRRWIIRINEFIGADPDMANEDLFLVR